MCTWPLVCVAWGDYEHRLVGSKLRLLDRNNDGLLSADELAMAISEILDGHSDEEAWAVVHSLDQDEDGMGTLLIPCRNERPMLCYGWGVDPCACCRCSAQRAVCKYRRVSLSSDVVSFCLCFCAVSLEQFGAWAAERLEDLRAKEERDLEELSDEDSRESRRRKTIRRVLKP